MTPILLFCLCFHVASTWVAEEGTVFASSWLFWSWLCWVCRKKKRSGLSHRTDPAIQDGEIFQNETNYLTGKEQHKLTTGYSSRMTKENIFPRNPERAVWNSISHFFSENCCTEKWNWRKVLILQGHSGPENLFTGHFFSQQSCSEI